MEAGTEFAQLEGIVVGRRSSARTADWRDRDKPARSEEATSRNCRGGQRPKTNDAFLPIPKPAQISSRSLNSKLLYCPHLTTDPAHWPSIKESSHGRKKR